MPAALRMLELELIDHAAEQVTDASPDFRHITAIIIGATSGIGAETARVLAKRGAKLVLPARSLKAAKDAKTRTPSEFPDSKIIVMALDLSSLASVRSFASKFKSLQLPLNLLINNARNGYSSKSTAEQVTDASPDLRHITTIIIGATLWIESETARVLDKRRAKPVLPARSLKAAKDAKARIPSKFPDSKIIIMALDLSSIASVRSFASKFESFQLPLNLLINNAEKFATESK
ncbi:hypothetical protein ACFX2A_024602 [Malus domestica]